MTNGCKHSYTFTRSIDDVIKGPISFDFYGKEFDHSYQFQKLSLT